MNKAIFLDRDGVINELVYSSERNEYEPPHKTEDLKLFDGVIDALKKFQKAGYKLFLISNQPDHAKGKTTLEQLNLVHNELDRIFKTNDIFFSEYYYCYHHPDGIVKEYSIDCECRKPKTYFVSKAVEQYEIDTDSSWLIGDRDKDIECGINSGIKTVLIKSEININTIKPDFEATDLRQALEIILSSNKK
jgi:D-glycero-D-manno-heptose 1,7-bisphosphate phosphatase